MGDIKLLPGGSAAPHMPDPDVVRILQDALDAAKRGEVVAAAIVTVNPAGAYTTSWDCAGRTRFALFAGAHKLMNRLAGD